jgi:hypothetical protein
MSTYTVTLPRRRSLWPALRTAQLAFLLPLGAVQLAAVAAYIGTTESTSRMDAVVGTAAVVAAVAAILVAFLLPRRTFFIRGAARILLRVETVVCLGILVGFGQLVWLAVLPIVALTSLTLWLDERHHPSFI